MPAMTKRVNIKANVAVRNVTPPIYGSIKDTIMTTGDILKCICKRAIVDEILNDGTLVRLTMKNYCTDNGAGLYVTKEKPAASTKKATGKKQTKSGKLNSKLGKKTVTQAPKDTTETTSLDGIPIVNNIDSSASTATATDTTEVNAEVTTGDPVVDSDVATAVSSSDSNADAIVVTDPVMDNIDSSASTATATDTTEVTTGDPVVDSDVATATSTTTNSKKKK